MPCRTAGGREAGAPAQRRAARKGQPDGSKGAPDGRGRGRGKGGAGYDLRCDIGFSADHRTGGFAGAGGGDIGDRPCDRAEYLSDYRPERAQPGAVRDGAAAGVEPEPRKRRAAVQHLPCGYTGGGVRAGAIDGDTGLCGAAVAAGGGDGTLRGGGGHRAPGYDHRAAEGSAGGGGEAL